MKSQQRLMNKFGNYYIEECGISRKYVFEDFIFELHGESEKFEDGKYRSLVSLIPFFEKPYFDDSVVDSFLPEVQIFKYSDILIHDDKNREKAYVDFINKTLPEYFENISSVVKFLPQQLIALYKKFKCVYVIELVCGLTGITSYIIFENTSFKERAVELFKNNIQLKLKRRPYLDCELKFHYENMADPEFVSAKEKYMKDKRLLDTYEQMIFTIKANSLHERLKTLDIVNVFLNSLSYLDMILYKNI